MLTEFSGGMRRPGLLLLLLAGLSKVVAILNLSDSVKDTFFGIALNQQYIGTNWVSSFTVNYHAPNERKCIQIRRSTHMFLYLLFDTRRHPLSAFRTLSSLITHTETFHCILRPSFFAMGIVGGRILFKCPNNRSTSFHRSTPFLNIHWYIMPADHHVLSTNL